MIPSPSRHPPSPPCRLCTPSYHNSRHFSFAPAYKALLVPGTLSTRHTKTTALYLKRYTRSYAPLSILHQPYDYFTAGHSHLLLTHSFSAARQLLPTHAVVGVHLTRPGDFHFTAQLAYLLAMDTSASSDYQHRLTSYTPEEHILNLARSPITSLDPLSILTSSRLLNTNLIFPPLSAAP